MSKRQFVKVVRAKREYKIYCPDIKKVYSVDKKRRPALPKFDPETSDEMTISQPVNLVHS